MKVIIYIFAYMFLTMAYYLTLSLFGTLFTDYITIITDPNWFVTYIIVFHWWLVILSLNEYYEKYLRNVF
jgi:hypothetical protein